jgi:hypothetical protein
MCKVCGRIEDTPLFDGKEAMIAELIKDIYSGECQVQLFLHYDPPRVRLHLGPSEFKDAHLRCPTCGEVVGRVVHDDNEGRKTRLNIKHCFGFYQKVLSECRICKVGDACSSARDYMMGHYMIVQSEIQHGIYKAAKPKHVKALWRDRYDILCYNNCFGPWRVEELEAWWRRYLKT